MIQQKANSELSDIQKNLNKDRIENLNNEQIMLIQNELTGIYQIVAEGYQNYSFTPDYVSKGYKSLSSAKKHFNFIVNK